MPKRPQKMRQIGGQKPVAEIPRWMRPKLNKTSLMELGLAHWTNLDALATGQGTTDIMWQVGGGILTWQRVADVVGQGASEMAEQLALFDRVVAHWQATGRVEWPTPNDYDLARKGAQVMDLLAELVDAYTALQAAIWAERRIKAIEAERGLQEVAHG